MDQKEFLTKYLAPLKGARITRIEIKSDDESEEFWPVLHVVTKSGFAYALEISQDEEGNGPGFIFGLPRPN